MEQDKEAETRPYPREIMTWTADYIYTPTFNRAMQDTTNAKVTNLITASQLLNVTNNLYDLQK